MPSVVRYQNYRASAGAVAEEHTPELSDAVVLAGGQSRRMERDKALLIVDGRTLLERMLVFLGGLCRRLLVSVPHDGPASAVSLVVAAAAQSGLDVDIVPDRRPGSLGPLAGVEAALERIEGVGAFFLAVDLPAAMDPGLVRALWRAAGAPGRSGAVPCWRGGVEAACAVYRRELLEPVRELLDAGERHLQTLVSLDGVCLLELEKGAAAAGEPREAAVVVSYRPPLEPRRLFRNLNTPSDYEEFLADRRRPV